jgi:hypothetical protein
MVSRPQVTSTSAAQVSCCGLTPGGAPVQLADAAVTEGSVRSFLAHFRHWP